MNNEYSGDSEPDWLSLGILLGAGSYVAGEVCNALYDDCTPVQKGTWRSNLPLHHGEVGIIALNAAKKEPDFRVRFCLTLLGAGLALSDIDDADEWHVKLE